ncbi:MAG: hypothetical protein RBS88_01180 [Spongiibacteraceae bacterium]|nr:hypothetical protein [Spongiibacteraceae bacterium]
MSSGINRVISLVDDYRAGQQAGGHVAMFHTGRVGSTVVAKLLEQHPQIHWDGELFERRLQRRRGKLRSKRRDLLPPLVDLRMRVGHAARAGRIYGFEAKHQTDQHGYVYGLEIGPFVDWLMRHGVDRFIEVRRENYLRQVVSTIRLRQTGRSHARIDQQVEHPPIVIDPEAVPLGRTQVSLLERFAIFDELHQATRRALQGQQALQLTYERDIERNPVAAYQRICAFLDLEPAPAEVRLRRTNDAPLTDLIANFDEVAERLVATPYSWMLEGEALPAAMQSSHNMGQSAGPASLS